MANVTHSSLTGSDLHEPKGAASAAANTVYVANGSGSGAWTATTALPAFYMINGEIDNISTADTVYVAVPFAGTVTHVQTVLMSAITTADSTITVANSSAGSMGTIVVAYSGSAGGDIDTLSPTSNNTVAADDYITVSTDGASGTAVKLAFTIVVETA